jgi:hypothetical protein
MAHCCATCRSPLHTGAPGHGACRADGARVCSSACARIEHDIDAVMRAVEGGAPATRVRAMLQSPSLEPLPPGDARWTALAAAVRARYSTREVSASSNVPMFQGSHAAVAHRRRCGAY